MSELFRHVDPDGNGLAVYVSGLDETLTVDVWPCGAEHLRHTVRVGGERLLEALQRYFGGGR